MGLVQRPQYQTGFISIAATTSTMAIHASAVQYFLQVSKQMFSSTQAVDTFSGFTSTSSSSTNLPSSAAAEAMSGCTNQARIAAGKSTLQLKNSALQPNALSRKLMLNLKVQCHTFLLFPWGLFSECLRLESSVLFLREPYHSLLSSLRSSPFSHLWR